MNQHGRMHDHVTKRQVPPWSKGPFGDTHTRFSFSTRIASNFECQRKPAHTQAHRFCLGKQENIIVVAGTVIEMKWEQVVWVKYN